MAKLTAPKLGASGKVDLDEDVFGEPFHEHIVHQCVVAELAARRRGTASTRDRSEVAMTGAKAWRQKGTGRARAGALSTPQRVGGGVAFGPKPRSYTVKVNRKVRRRAMRAALSVHAERGSLAVVEPADFETPSTKQAVGALEDFAQGPALVLVAGDDAAGCGKSFRNIAGVKVGDAVGAGVADVIRAARLVLSPSAIEHFSALRSDRTADRRTRAPGPGRGGGGGGVNPRSVIIRPVVSEKSYALLAAGKYTFRVHDRAHKTEIRQAVEEVFGVRVLAVRTMNVKPKPKRRGLHAGHRRRWKKAVVQLHPEDSIELFEGQDA